VGWHDYVHLIRLWIVACGSTQTHKLLFQKFDFWFPECCKAGESCETATGMEHTALHHNSLFRQVFYLCPQQATELLCYCHVHSIETSASVQHLQVSGTVVAVASLTLWTWQEYIYAWPLLPVSANGVFIRLHYSRASTVRRSEA